MLNTVHPKTMVEYALESEKKWDDKKLIIWFIQPHVPFIEHPKLCHYDAYKRVFDIAESDEVSSIITPWKEADKGNLKIEEAWNAYKRNLEIAVEYAFELAEKLKGKTVITSDHGHAFKRLPLSIAFKIVGHPSGVYISELVKVPWLAFEGK
ncbi:MAG: hypothetical protein QME40_01850 [bacterium]|nr:hypothetical protein [bacterium]